MMPAGNCLWKQSYQCTRVSTVSSELNRVDACVFQSKCSTHIMHALTAGCPSMSSWALSAGHKEPVHSWIQQFLRVINADAEALRLAVH